LLHGRDGAAVERLLGQLFSLCAHAHQRTARLALQAAGLPDHTMLQPEPSMVMLLDTARDHLRSMAMDWPRRQAGVPGSPVDLGWLHGCPLPLVAPRQVPTEDQARDELVKLQDWLEGQPLQQPVDEWLALHSEAEGLAHWCRSRAQDFYPAQCLDRWYPLASALTPGTRCLNVLSADPFQQATNLLSIAKALETDPLMAQYPTWQGACAETGPWARSRHEPHTSAAQTGWTRLASRWIELLEIASSGSMAGGQDSPPLLSCGALALGGHQAIAWCEMARGLLLHWLRLDAQGHVLDYKVLAPTEWNFHPHGGLSKAVSALGPHDTASAWALAAAYDACVECSVRTH
jgi:hypothetical protein